jgi:mxaC protein
MPAHIVLLIDRSSSMDNSFANRRPTGEGESKSAAARRLIADFVARRPHDRIGIAAFSTSPMPVLPLTEHHEAVQAAVAAIDRPGLAYTDVGRGLLLAMSMAEEDAAGASRAVVLVSDGAAVIDRRVQDQLRDAATRSRLNLYWLFLRSKGQPRHLRAPVPGRA